ncbi:MAG: SDR family oxidoreductase [Ferruginibacter sp.]
MIIVITGASRGIGFSIAKKFAKNGYTIIACSQNEENLHPAVQSLMSEFPDVKIYSKATDLSKEDNVNEFAKWCLSIGVPDIIINNAGYFIPGECISEEDGNLEKMLSVNLLSAYWLTRALVKQMISNGSGHIFNMCSVAALKAYPGGGSYSISKFALHGFNQNLRKELMNTPVKVTGIYPGAVFTDSWVGFDNSSGRLMEVNDISDMIFAASKLSLQATVEDIIIRPQKGDL